MVEPGLVVVEVIVVVGPGWVLVTVAVEVTVVVVAKKALEVKCGKI